MTLPICLNSAPDNAAHQDILRRLVELDSKLRHAEERLTALERKAETPDTAEPKS